MSPFDKLPSIRDLRLSSVTTALVLLWLCWSMLYCYFHRHADPANDANLAQSLYWTLGDYGMWLLLAPLLVRYWHRGVINRRVLLPVALSLLALPASAIASLGFYTVAGDPRPEPLHALYLQMPRNATFLATLLGVLAVGALLKQATKRKAPADAGTSPAERFIQVDLGAAKALMRMTSVRWVRAAGNYCEVNDGTRTGLVRSTLSAMERSLDPGRFRRVHRSFVINLDYIDRIDRQPKNGRPLVQLAGCETPIPVSRSGLARLRAAERGSHSTANCSSSTGSGSANTRT